jgi:sugar diacid utilization regulator
MRSEAVIERVLSAVESGWPELVDGTVDSVWSQVPAYAGSDDDTLRRDLRDHVDAVFRVLLVCLRENRLAVREDFPNTHKQAYRRLEAGVLLSDFLQAFRIGQLHIWHGILDAVPDDPEARDVALRMVDKVMHVIEVGSTVAAEAYLEAQQYNLADQDRRVRDLFEDLLRRDDVSSSSKQAMLRAAGIHSSSRVMMLSAVPVVPLTDERKFRLAHTAVRAGRAHGVVGLAATRRGEIIGMTAIGDDGPEQAILRLERAIEELARSGVAISAGLGTVRNGLMEVPEGYAEAVEAREALAGRPGVVALTRLSTFDYLVLRDVETARRLVRPELQRFVEADLFRGGVLVGTLEEYAACDLNAKLVAERLHMHVNTVYYRLGKVAERTGRDLRSFADVLELVIAVRLQRNRGMSQQ